MSSFCHLHCHTSYSLLDGAARIDRLVQKAAALDMGALGITDHGNLYGVPEFYFAAKKAGISPVIGCEFYLCTTPMQERINDTRYHQVLWAKSEQGYRNLIALSSKSFLEGFYYKPRIDFATLEAHSEGLVATTCCLQGHVPQLILKDQEKEARAWLERFREVFGEDYFIELMNHELEQQQRINSVLVRWAGELNIRVLATNDVHYVAREDHAAQDILLCLQTGKDLDDPRRLRFDSDQYYLKDTSEMRQAMSFLPDKLIEEAVHTPAEVADRCQFELSTGKLLMPHYPLPGGFDGNMDAYLRHLVFEGAQRRWSELSEDIVARLNHELGIIAQMGYAGYFLIVQDFTTAAREMKVSVGPARGSAAGSAVAYCLGITSIDPLQYDLLFERFLNPERISMPDIDIDFDDRGRGKVIDYVVKKYGRAAVCQIITFGSMGAKTSVRDVARVLKIPQRETNRIAKLIPEGPKVTLAKAMDQVPKFRALVTDERPEIQKLLQYAKVLEGSARHTSIHAAGVIIAPGRVQDFVPIQKKKSRDTSGEEVRVSQYDGRWVERFGLLKMDLLGLSTLTTLDDACANILKYRGERIDLESIPLDDGPAFKIFQRGDTSGIFQFESEGMRNWLTKLRPTSIDDLIAMNALYRPGPMDLIPDFVERKHGRQKPDYGHPMLEPVLKRTFGIPVYQEQVMQMAQVMGGYSLGAADILRRAMGKKKPEEMARQRTTFVEGARQQGVEEEVAQAVFDKMEKFAGYGFNKSHSAAYSLLAYRTAYLKANYAPEFMAAVMSHPNTSAKVLNMLRAEAAQSGIRLLPPSVHSSQVEFSVEDGHIRFGMCAIKGVQRSAVHELVEARKEGKSAQTLYSLLKGLDLQKVPEKTLENLAMAGALDDLEGHRRQLHDSIKATYAAARDSRRLELMGQMSLFAVAGPQPDVAAIPPLAKVEPWTREEQQRTERELTGIFISGHPLDDYKIEAKSLATGELGASRLVDLATKDGKRRKAIVCGVITKVSVRTTKKGKRMISATIEDYFGSGVLTIWPSDVERLEPAIKMGAVVLVTGELQVRGGTVEVMASDVMPLSVVRDKKLTAVEIRLDAATLSSEEVDRIRGICRIHPGPCHVNVFLKDAEAKGGYLRLRSRSYQVRPTGTLLRELTKLLGERNILVESSKL